MNKLISPKAFKQTWRFFNRMQSVTFLLTCMLGNLKWRRRNGLLHSRLDLIKQIESQLKPFDIILHNKPYYITDWFIPGFFTHGAIYLGPINEIQQFNPLDAPANHNGICSIIEATTDGVVISDFQKFLNCDSFVILRDPHLNFHQKCNLAENAVLQLGKEYDYGFDIKCKTRQFCAKLIADLYDHIPFYKFGEDCHTILPDHICRIALNPNDYPLEVKMLVVDGSQVIQQKTQDNLSELLNNGLEL